MSRRNLQYTLALNINPRLYSYFQSKVEGVKKPVVETIRGCFGEKDVAGTVVHAGCVGSSIHEDICLCSDDLCNVGSRTGAIKIIATFLTAAAFWPLRN